MSYLGICCVSAKSQQKICVWWCLWGGMGAADDLLLLTKSTVYVGYLSLSLSSLFSPASLFLSVCLSPSLHFSFLSLSSSLYLSRLHLIIMISNSCLSQLQQMLTIILFNSLATFQYSQSLYKYFPLMSSSLLPYLWNTFGVQWSRLYKSTFMHRSKEHIHIFIPGQEEIARGHLCRNIGWEIHIQINSLVGKYLVNVWNLVF